ncbi:MAG: AraC family transcriptional regulator [Gemmatimonadota bacterium]
MTAAFPRPNPVTGFAVRRTDLPLGLDFLACTLSGHEFPRHVHEGYTIGVVHSGRFEYWCGGATRVCHPGSLILMNPGEVHTGRARSGFAPALYQVIYPTVELVETLVGHARPLARFESADAGLVAQFRRLAAAAGSSQEVKESPGVLASVLERFLSALGAPSESGTARRRHQLACLARDFLKRNLQARPTLEDLAKNLGLHPGYIRRVFCEVTGLSPRSYLVQLRVMRARQLLGKGVPIAEVVAAAGFTDQAHLTHEFKRTMGFPPGRFLRELGYR